MGVLVDHVRLHRSDTLIIIQKSACHSSDSHWLEARLGLYHRARQVTPLAVTSPVERPSLTPGRFPLVTLRVFLFALPRPPSPTRVLSTKSTAATSSSSSSSTAGIRSFSRRQVPVLSWSVVNLHAPPKASLTISYRPREKVEGARTARIQLDKTRSSERREHHRPNWIRGQEEHQRASHFASRLQRRRVVPRGWFPSTGPQVEVAR